MKQGKRHRLHKRSPVQHILRQFNSHHIQFSKTKVKQDKHSTYNVILRRFRVTIVVMEKQ